MFAFTIKIVAEGVVFATIVAVFSNLPNCALYVAISKVTKPSSPGAIGSFSKSETVHVQLPETVAIINGEFPVFFTMYFAETISPFNTFPALNNCFTSIVVLSPTIDPFSPHASKAKLKLINSIFFIFSLLAD